MHLNRNKKKSKVPQRKNRKNSDSSNCSKESKEQIKTKENKKDKIESKISILFYIKIKMKRKRLFLKGNKKSMNNSV